MADITKCVNEVCPLRDTCYRATAPDSYMQSVACFNYENGKCENYYER